MGKRKDKTLGDQSIMDGNESLTAKSAEEKRSAPQIPEIIGVTRKDDNNVPSIPDVLPILPVRSSR